MDMIVNKFIPLQRRREEGRKRRPSSPAGETRRSKRTRLSTRSQSLSPSRIRDIQEEEEDHDLENLERQKQRLLHDLDLVVGSSENVLVHDEGNNDLEEGEVPDSDVEEQPVTVSNKSQTATTRMTETGNRKDRIDTTGKNKRKVNVEKKVIKEKCNEDRKVTRESKPTTQELTHERSTVRSRDKDVRSRSKKSDIIKGKEVTSRSKTEQDCLEKISSKKRFNSQETKNAYRTEINEPMEKETIKQRKESDSSSDKENSKEKSRDSVSKKNKPECSKTIDRESVKDVETTKKDENEVKEREEVRTPAAPSLRLNRECLQVGIYFLLGSSRRNHEV